MSEGFWTEEQEIIEALISMARSAVTHDSMFLMHWRDYAYGADPRKLTEQQALDALDWLDERLALADTAEETRR